MSKNPGYSNTELMDTQIEEIKKLMPNRSDESDTDTRPSDYEIVSNHFDLNKEKPKILVQGGNLHEVVDEAERFYLRRVTTTNERG